MTIASDVQKLEPGDLVDLYVLDATPLGGIVARLHPGTNVTTGAIVWQGEEYQPFPMDATGFERAGQGPMPRPRVRVANVTGLISALCLTYQDMVGAKLTRKRTFAKYLDAANFGGTNPTADPNVHFPDEVYWVDRKATENKVFVDWELAALFDVQGVQIPRRPIVQNICVWKYRSAECSYAGGPVATADDVPTGLMSYDVCGKRLHSCKMRFGAYAELPFGGEPSVGLIR